jgi:hypothetical protein
MTLYFCETYRGSFYFAVDFDQPPSPIRVGWDHYRLYDSPYIASDANGDEFEAAALTLEHAPNVYWLSPYANIEADKHGEVLTVDGVSKKDYLRELIKDVRVSYYNDDVCGN